MSIWAIADLHLCLGVPEKHMGVFGPAWEHYIEKIEQGWRSVVLPEDLVLIPGDISWAMHQDEAKLDLTWIDQLPGTKLLLKGNHDYWWGSLSKVKALLPPSCHVLQHDSFVWQDKIGIAGSRLWDTDAFNFDPYISFQPNAHIKKATEIDHSEEREKIFQRELIRLEMSLKTLSPSLPLKIAMTHYPPISGDLQDSKVSYLLEKYGVSICVFGHLHHVKKDVAIFGEHHGIHYYLTAADYLDFKPLKII